MKIMKKTCDCGCGTDCNDGCVTNSAPSSVYACVGASNVGVISFELAKSLQLDGTYRMGCSVCVGAGDCGCGSAQDLLIDGCKTACLKKMFEKQGKTGFKHVILTQLGVRKEGTFDFDQALIPELKKKISDKGF